MNAPAKRIEAATLASAMAAAFGEIEGATKSAANEAFKRGGKASKYADITAVIEAIKPALIKHGLFFTQRPQPSENGITIETVLHHASGDQMSLGSLFVPANKHDAQGFGSALTYARRYALVTAFGVPVEDDDGNAAARGQSKGECTVSPSQPLPKEPAHSKLKTELRGFVRELESVGDWDTYCAFRDTADFQRLVAECQDKLPHWWNGWDEQPDGFVPLHRRIELLEANLAQNIADVGATG